MRAAVPELTALTSPLTWMRLADNMMESTPNGSRPGYARGRNAGRPRPAGLLGITTSLDSGDGTSARRTWYPSEV